LPRGDGNVGVDEMVRALGLSTDKGEHLKPLPPSAEGEDEGSADAGDAPYGYKNLDVSVEWGRFGPSEVLQRRRQPSSLLPDKVIPEFAGAWLAFDGFSPESARGAHTPNLLRAREKWRGLAPATASSSDDPSAGANETAGEVEVEPAPAEADVNVAPGDWEPILSHSPPSTPESDVDIHTTDDLAPVTAAAPSAAAVPPTLAPSSPPGLAHTEIPASPKMSRRERILHIARQNAQTPLPKLAERSPPVVEAEKPQEESEQEGKERTIRERLWRLVGRNF